MSGRIIIVGAGHAAGQLVMSLRGDGFSGPITVIGEEPQVPYQRPPLSKHYLGGEVGQAKLYLRPVEWYRDAGIDLILDTAVTGIDRAAKTIALSDGRTMEYDQLGLTIGSRVRTLPIPGVDLPGVFYLRTIQDVDRIREHFVAGRRLAIIGGGYIGLEATAVAVKKGLLVTVLEMDTRVMSRVVAPIMSEFFENIHRTAGVDVRTSVRVTGIARNEDSLSVGSDCGALVEADVVIIGVGIVPNVELAAAAGLPTDNGILVDEFGRTSDPRIVAAGDCTNHPSLIYGRRVRLESVQNAMSQARVAAAALAGKPKPDTDVPTFWSEQYDLRLQIAGLSQNYDDVIVRGDPAERAFALFYLKEGILVAVDAINKPTEFMHSRRLIADRARVAPDRLKDPAVPVQDAVKL
ncbi:MAG: NAD(P)/FAD-dependent oxidoreductase [Gammaproteobacteria bacterium]